MSSRFQRAFTARAVTHEQLHCATVAPRFRLVLQFMHRLPLILCTLALIGSTVSAGLYFEIGNSKQVLAQQLADVSQRAARTDRDLAAAHQQNGALKSELGSVST